MKPKAIVLVLLLGLLQQRFLFSQSSDSELVELRQIVPDIALDLRYATPNNFLHEKMYDTGRAYLAYGAAKDLKKVQDSLRVLGLGLKIWDAYRPLTVQQLMWEKVPNSNFVADPRKGSMHNRGAAVDVTLIDLATGKELQMPTGFDDFTERASHRYLDLPSEVIRNRILLKDIMEHVGGFLPYDAEWWHYTHRKSAAYPVLDIQIR